MKHFIGIVPPPDIYQTVVDIQKPFGDNRLEPHITLRPPVIVTDQAGWIKAIEDVCYTFERIHISLPAAGNFGNRVLFIDVKSKGLNALHTALLKAVKPYEKIENQQEDDRPFNPHLTLGRSWCGFTRDDFAAMKILANDYLAKTPVSFNVETLRIYHKPKGHGPYETLKDVPLKAI